MKKTAFTVPLVLALLAVGCAKNNAQSDAKSIVLDDVPKETAGSAEAANAMDGTGDAQAFLEEFFALDKGQRYSGLQESDLLELDAYYQPLASLATEEVIEKLTADRMPVKYDKIVAENETQAAVTDVLITPYEGDSYEYQVSLEVGNAGDRTTGTVSGQISVDEDGKVRHFYIRDNQAFWNLLEGE